MIRTVVIAIWVLSLSSVYADTPYEVAVQSLAAENLAVWDQTGDPIAYENLQALHELWHRSTATPFRQGVTLQIMTEIQIIRSLLPVASPVFKSSDINVRIEPSPEKNGNVTGAEFPKGTWSITFDDGPHATLTAQILANLKRFAIPATFFELAENIFANRAVSLSVQTAWHEMANHSYTHPNLYKATDAELEREITVSTQKEAEIWGLRPKLFRAPYGNAFHPNIREKIALNQLIHVFWNVDTLDWVASENPPEAIYKRAIQQIESAENQGHGGILLFHDIHARSVTASQMVMEYLQRKKFRMLPVGQVIDLINQGRPHG